MSDTDKARLAFETALAGRNFEIELVWKRSQFFWLVNAAALAGFIAIGEKDESYQMIVVCFGMVSSFSWILINIGSKWWQEAWERKLKDEQNYLCENFFENYAPEKNRLFIFPLVRFSVTGVVTAFSCFVFMLWLVIGVYLLGSSITFIGPLVILEKLKELMLFSFTILFCVMMLRLTKKLDK